MLVRIGTIEIDRVTTVGALEEMVV